MVVYFWQGRLKEKATFLHGKKNLCPSIVEGRCREFLPSLAKELAHEAAD
jgi:hypothetical protein